MAALVFLAECTFISCMIHQINTQTRTSATQRLRECEAGRTEHQTNLRKSNRRCKRLNCIESKHTGDNKVFIRNRNSLFSRRNDCSLLPSPAALGRVGPSAAAVGGTLCLLSAALDSRPLRGRSRCCCCFRRHLFLPTHLSPAPRRHEGELPIRGRCMQRGASKRVTLLPFSGLFKVLIKHFTFRGCFTFRIDSVLNTLDIFLILNFRNGVG